MKIRTALRFVAAAQVIMMPTRCTYVARPSFMAERRRLMVATRS